MRGPPPRRLGSFGFCGNGPEATSSTCSSCACPLPWGRAPRVGEVMWSSRWVFSPLRAWRLSLVLPWSVSFYPLAKEVEDCTTQILSQL